MSNSRNSGSRGILEILSNLPPQYPLSEIVVDGETLSVTFFVSYDPETHLAVFTDGANIVVADARRISELDFT